MSAVANTVHPERRRRAAAARGGPFAWLLVAVALAPSTAALAQSGLVGLNRSASILILPKVIVDAGQDTIIQVSNTSNSLVHARCFYVATTGGQQTQSEFSITVASARPTFWVASQGLLPGNAPPGFSNLIPALAMPFQGDLLCVEVDAVGAPIGGNHLVGEATLVDTSSGDVAKYYAIGLLGNENNDGNNTLCLGGGITANCPNGPEYDACPQSWRLDHFADGAEDSVIGAGSAIHTNLTLLPCTQDLTSQSPQTVNVGLSVTDGFGQRFSIATGVTGWSDLPLATIDNIFSRDVLQTDHAQTQVSPAQPGDGNGVMALAQEFHDSGPPASSTASAAINLYPQGQRVDGDQIVLPATVALPPQTAVFPLPAAAGCGPPRRITAGPDGNLWFTAMCTDLMNFMEADRVGRIATAGAPIDLFAVPTMDASPNVIAPGPDGNLWFTEDNASQVGRVTAAGSVTEFAIPTNAAGITGGPDGNVWFTESATNMIGRITPDGSSVTEFPIPPPAGGGTSGLSSITTGPDGNLWFTEGFGNKIGRITPDGSSVTEFDIPTPNSSPSVIILGPDGNLWFVEQDASQIGRITPDGSSVEEFDSLGSPLTISAGADGNLWFCAGGSIGGIGRVTPVGVVTLFNGYCGNSITNGPDNNLWFTSFRGIGRFMP
jgi:virginiamycin B lyase